MAKIRESRELYCLAVELSLATFTVLACLVNLSFFAGSKESSAVWIGMMSAALGYIMPNPKFAYHPEVADDSQRKRLRKLIYFTQIAICFLVFVVGVVNMSCGRDRSRYWLSLTTSISAFFLPTPTPKKFHKIIARVTSSKRELNFIDDEDEDRSDGSVQAPVQTDNSGPV